jgi:steroid delta-isomerase-like uncharacterized protein
MTNEAILRLFMQRVWNDQDFESVEQFVDDAYTIHLDNADPWEGKTLNHEEYKKRLKFSFDSFPDMHFAIQSLVEDGNCVAISWIMTGTNLGNIGPMPPTGKAINTTGITIYHFKNGKVNGHTQVFDRATVMKQLGFA